MPTPTYLPVYSTTLSANTTIFDLTGLDTLAADYRDLVLTVEGTITSSGFPLRLYLNPSGGGQYFSVFMETNGSSQSSAAISASYFYSGWNYGTWNTSVTSSWTVNIFDFAQTTKHKSVISVGGRGDSAMTQFSGRWASTNAVTAIRLQSNSGNLAAGMKIAIWGIGA